MSPPKLQVHLLGPVDTFAEGGRLDLPPSRKARALLAYLAATDRPHGRSALCDLFWQDVHDPRAGLRWALSKLRAAMGSSGLQPIAADRDRVGFDSTDASVDLHRVRSLVPHDPSDSSTQALQRAAKTFRGEFLEGLDLPGCHQYEAWCLGRREDLRRLRIGIHQALAHRLRAADLKEALSHALARLSLDAATEEAYIEAMDLLGEAGRIDKGLEIYDRCRRMLSRHLGVPPSPALQSARRRLRKGRPVARSPNDSGREAAETPDTLAEDLAELEEPEHLPAPAAGDPQLVGREAEVAAFEALITQSTSSKPQPGILVTGEAGIGKTRLLRELAHRVRDAGGCVLSGRVFETEEVRPYGPWADMLRAIPSTALDAESKAGLSGLLTTPGDQARTKGPTERAQLFDAAAHLLRRIASARAPVLVVLDDLQWLDAASIALLHYLIRVLPPDPLVFALAAREEEVHPGSAVHRMLRSLEEADRLRRFPLERLNAAQTEALVNAVDQDLDPEAVFATSEGNPLFALHVAKSLQDGAEHTPASIEEELRDRLERLEPRARSVLPWAASLGRVFDVPTLVHVVERPAHELLEAVASLESSGIVRATGPDRFEFTHSLLREVAYGQPSDPLRRQIHRSIAHALESLGPDDRRTPSAVAYHAELAGMPALSARAYAEAAEDSLWVFAFEEAETMLERGLTQMDDLPDETRIPLEMRLLQLFAFRSMRNHRPTEVEAHVRRVTEEARHQGLTQVVAKGHACLMELQYQRGAYDEAGRSSLRFAEAGRKGEPATAVPALAETAACLLLLDRDPDAARRLASEAFRVAREHQLETSAIALARALLDHHEGRLEAASRGFQDVIRLGRKEKDRWWEHPAMTRMIMVELDRGDAERARSLARDAERLGDRIGDHVVVAFARGLGAIAEAQIRAGNAQPTGNAEESKAVDDALIELRELDSLWRIGHVQAYAAELEMQRNRPDAAQLRIEESLEAARALDRPSLQALAKALQAHACALAGDGAAARHHLDAPEITDPEHRLSHRARESIARAREATYGRLPA